ncbi:MAG: class I SAM-dependent methyltransferase [Planctomycetota bacterium]
MTTTLDTAQQAATDSSGSISNRMRNKRFAFFESLCEPLPRPLSILDIGGTTEFWRQRGWAGRDDVNITLVNLKAEEQTEDNITPTVNDATALEGIDDGSYDIAFSNSVIEHVFTWENQVKMAAEVRRVGKAYFLQTPNFWFPIEPHFLFPGWHYLPTGVRIAILRRRRVGWRGPCPDAQEARALVEEIRLLSGSEMRRLFPDGTIKAEKYRGLTKSWMAYRGLGQGSAA